MPTLRDESPFKERSFPDSTQLLYDYSGWASSPPPWWTQVTSSSDPGIEHGNHAPSQRRRPVLNSSARRALTEKTQKAFVRPQKSLCFHVPDLRTGAQPYGMERATGTFAGLSSSRACEY